MQKRNHFLPPIFFSCLLITFLQAAASEIHAVVKDGEGHMLEDTVITATPLDIKNIPKKKTNNQVVDQIDKEFVPLVMPVYVNSLVYFPNKDNIRHQVYSFSPAKKFELPLYAGSTAPPVLFDKPGVVVLGCNIHDWMIGYIYVSDTPYFAKSEHDGKALIRDLPAGEYLVKVWHPQLAGTEESTSRRIKVGDSVANDLEWQLPLKAAFKIPRTSAGRSTGYH
jgi:plastocyanin